MKVNNISVKICSIFHYAPISVNLFQILEGIHSSLNTKLKYLVDVMGQGQPLGG